MSDPHARNLGLAAGTLLATSSTLVYCVLPAVLVAVGAGSVLVGLVSAVSQLVWLSEHKAAVFGFAGGRLAVSGVVLWRARRLPCPTDTVAARLCTRLRKMSQGLYLGALAAFVIGAAFAFVFPQILR